MSSERRRRGDRAADERSENEELDRRALALMADGYDWLSALAEARRTLGDMGRPAPGRVTRTMALPAATVMRHAEVATVPDQVPDEVGTLSGGEALPSKLLAELEASLGFELGAVRVHTGADADAAARALGARAFAVGRDIGFKSGAYDPESPDGVRLIAHEVAHTTQAPSGAPVSHPDDPAERDAEGFAERFTAARPAGPAAPATPAAVERPTHPLPAATGGARPRLAREPGVAKPEPTLPAEARFILGVAEGVVREAGPAFTPESLARIERELRDPVSLLVMAAGYHVGGPKGALQSLADNVTALGELALWLLWNTTPAGQMKDMYEWMTDPVGKAEREAAKRAKIQALGEGLKEFAFGLATDPSFVSDLGDAAGAAVGQHVANFYAKTFVDAPAFTKGELIGKGAGYIVMEVALCIVGPEILVARVPAAIARLAAAGSKTAAAVTRMMRRVPALARLLEAKPAATAAAAVEKQAAKQVGKDLEEAGAKAATPKPPEPKPPEPKPPEPAPAAEPDVADKIFVREVEFTPSTGRTYNVKQRGDINWDQVRAAGDKNFIGKTNAEAARAGKPPQLPDGNFATLHHSQQNARGPWFEVSTKSHNIRNAKEPPLHPFRGEQHPHHPLGKGKGSLRDDFQSAESPEYWRWREQNR